jgi:hypothetical protein
MLSTTTTPGARQSRGIRLLALLSFWLARERSEDPAERPAFGLREAHLYPGLLMLALGLGILAGLALSPGYGTGTVLTCVGAGLFRLGRRP